jgi:hypothetical protein
MQPSYFLVYSICGCVSRFYRYLAGVIVLAIASLFGLVLFASREETFEDVVEKQRKAQEALLYSLQQGSGKSGKQNRKWNKLKNKKAAKPKESEEIDHDSGVDDDEVSTETVTIDSPPPMIAVEEPAPAPAASKKKKKKKNKNQQEIVEIVTPEVEEPAPVAVEEEEIAVEVEAEVEAAPELPSDDEVVDVPVELSVEEIEETVEAEEPVAELEEVVESVELESEVEPVPEPEAEPEPAVAPEPVPEPEPVVTEKAKSGKKKNKSAKKAAPVLNTNSVEKLQTDLENCHLQADEVQTLMDLLLEKQSELEQWQKPGQKADPMEQLKRKMTELEEQFTEERQNAQAISLKLKDSKLELQQERNARQLLQNDAQNKINQQAKEHEAIRKHLEDKHLSEMHSAQSQISRMQGIIDVGANNDMENQRLKEENTHMKNSSMIAQQLAEDKQSLMTELNQLKNTNRALRQEFDNLIIQHQQEMQNMQIAKVDSEGALSQRLQEMNEQLMKVEAHNRNLQLEIAEQLSQQARLTEQAREVETFQMQAKPDALENEELKKQLDELSEKCKEYEMKLTSSAAEVEVANEETTKTAELFAQVAEKEKLILELESKVSLMEAAGQSKTTSGQQSPTDLVVVEPPLLSSESFEQINPDKDYEAEVEMKSSEEMVEEVIEPVEEAPVESGPSDVVLTEPEVIAIEVTSEESTPEITEDTTEQLTAELNQLKADYQSAQETIATSVSTHEAAIAAKQIEIDELQQRILDMQTDALAAEPVAATGVVDETVAIELQAKITLLEETLNVKDLELAKIKDLEEALAAKDVELVKIKELEEALAARDSEKPAAEEEEVEDGPSKDELTEQLKTVKEDLQTRTEATDELKLKNNELREKNWKVIDALAKAEKQVEDQKKSTDIRIIKGLKSIIPEFSIPKFEDDYELLFKEFGDKVTETTSAAAPVDDSANEELLKEVESLKEDNAELRKTNELMNASQDEMLKGQQENGQLKEENAHIKNVLIETESMLCRLQTGVDAEVQKWQAKVTEKDAELDTNKTLSEQLKQTLSKHGYNGDDLTALDNKFTEGHKLLADEKEENSKLKTQIEELDARLADTQKQLDTKLKELSEEKQPSTNAEEVTELQSKLKKTISERDLLIREYKNVKDSNTKMEAELKATKESLETLKEQNTTVAGDSGEKDAVIKNEM